MSEQLGRRIIEVQRIIELHHALGTSLEKRLVESGEHLAGQQLEECLSSIENTLKGSYEALLTGSSHLRILEAELVASKCRIHRLPVELLREIFSYVIGGTDLLSQRLATSLLQTCRSWRFIVLSMHRVWSQFEYSLDRPKRQLISIGEFLTQTLHRSPSELVLIVPEQDSEDNLRLLPLNALSPFESLAFFIPGEDEEDACNSISLEALCDRQYTNLDCRCSTLWLEGYLLGVYDIKRLNLSDLLTRFQGVKQLRLRDVKGIELTRESTSCLHNLTDVELRNLRYVPILALLSATPSLTRLVLDNCIFEVPDNHSVVECRLQTLLVQDCIRDWLVYIHCEYLTELCLSGHDPGSDDDFDFIRKSQTIEDLTFGSMDCDHIRQLAVSAPGIKQLTLSGDCHQLPRWVSETRSNLWFPKLRILGIKSTCSCVTMAIEELVRARCLPQAHQDSQMVAGLEPLERLTISGGLAYSMATNSLFQTATSSVREPTTDALAVTWI